MICKEISVEKLLSLNEDNLIMMLPPGRMGGDDTLLVYKEDDEFFEYYIDGTKYYDEINDTFPKRKEAYEYYHSFEEYYYFLSDYYAINMGMGCFIYIKKEYSKDFVLNVQKLQEQKYEKELFFGEVLDSRDEICEVWREAAKLTINNIK